MDLRVLFNKRPDWNYSPDYRRQQAEFNLPKPMPKHKIG